jgi:hypothetical protein
MIETFFFLCVCFCRRRRRRANENSIRKFSFYRVKLKLYERAKWRVKLSWEKMSKLMTSMKKFEFELTI